MNLKSFLINFIFIYSGVVAQKPKLLLPAVSNNSIGNAFITPNQKLLIASTSGSANSSKEIKVWDTRSKKLLYTIKDNFIFKGSNSVSLDGKKLITTDERKINIWNLDKEAFEFSIPEKIFTEYAEFSHNGQMIVTSIKDSLKIWDANDGHFLFSFERKNNYGYPTKFSPDDKSIVTYENGLITVWSTATGELISSYQAANDYRLNYLHSTEENRVNICRISNDSRYLITSFYDSTLYIRDLIKSQELPLVKEKISNASISKDGKTIAAVVKNRLDIYNIVSNKIIFCSQAKTNIFEPQVSLGNSHKYFLLTKDDESTEIFSLSEGKLLEKVATPYKSLDPPELANNDSFLIYKDERKGIIFLNTLGHGKSIGPADIFTWHSRNLNINFTNNYDTIISSSDDSLIRTWNYKKGELYNTYKIPEHSYITDKYLFYLKEQIEFSENTEDTIVFKEPVTGKTLKRIPVNNCHGNLFISPDNKLIAVDGGIISQQMQIIDIGTQKVVKKFTKSSGNPVEKLIFIPNTQKVLMTDQILPESVEIFDIHTGSLYFKMKNHAGEEFKFSDIIHDISFSPDGKFIASASEIMIKIFNVPEKKYVKTFNHEDGVSVSAFSPDKKYFVYGLKDGTLYITDGASFSIIKRFRVNNSSIYKLVFSEDSKYLLSADDIGNIYLLETNSFTPVKHVIAGKTERIQAVDFKSKRLFVSDGSIITLYDISREKKIYSFASFLKNDFIFLLSNNYYYTTPAASATLTWLYNGNVYSFSQFDTKYNRPDIVLDTLRTFFGNTDTSLIYSYKQAFNKRIKKLGININVFQNDFTAPVFDLVNRNEVEYEQKSEKLILKIHGSDSNYKLDFFNIWVNEVPLYGLYGISIKGRNSFDTIIKITLSSGDNMIEASITNLNEAESFRIPLFVKYIPSIAVKEKLHFIGG